MATAQIAYIGSIEDDLVIGRQRRRLDLAVARRQKLSLAARDRHSPEMPPAIALIRKDDRVACHPEHRRLAGTVGLIHRIEDRALPGLGLPDLMQLQTG